MARTKRVHDHQGQARAVAIAVAAGLFGVTSVAAGSLSTENSATVAISLPQEDLDEHIRFRTEHGLRADVGYVTSVSDADASSDQFGVPLTATETALMIRRGEITEELQSLRTYGRVEHPEVWGGLWLTYPTGGTTSNAMTVNVGLTADVERHSAAVRDRVPAGVTLEIHPVENTLAALDELHPVIAGARPLFKALETKLYSIATLVPENVVEVSVSRLSPEIETTLRSRFGPTMVRVREGMPVQPDVCTRENCGPPWKGGIHIWRSGGNCTSGFVVRKSSGGSYIYAVYTAGHCGSATWKQGSGTGTTIGTTSANYFADGSTADVQVIPIASSNKTNQIIDATASCNPCNLRVFTSAQQAYEADEPGDTVCNNGYKTGRTCGTISSTNFTFTYDAFGATLFHQRRATYARQEGDSGGPVFTTVGSKAVGSHVHYEPIGGTNYPVYSHVWEMTVKTGYTVYYVP